VCNEDLEGYTQGFKKRLKGDNIGKEGPKYRGGTQKTGDITERTNTCVVRG